jgi:hypothetical protein
MALVLVDAENVRRSRWPNVRPGRLVELARHWSDLNGHDVLVVFDGPAPVEADDVVGTGDVSADDWLVQRSRKLRGAREAYWLVTSDRALRAAAGEGSERIVGGGAFLRELLALPRA